MADISRIKKENPWWRRAGSIDSDEKIVRWTRSAARRDPPLRARMEYDFEPDNTVVYTLRGPGRRGRPHW